MHRPAIWALSLAVIFIALVLSGCTGGTATIKGNVSDSWDPHHPVSGVLVMASPQDGSAPVYNVSDDSGNFTLRLRPDIRYNISGICYDQYGQYSNLDFRYLDDNFSNEVTLAPGESARIKVQVFWHHPPKSFLMRPNPINGSPEFAPPMPVSISGHVYLDGKAVSGATVEAASAYGQSNVSAVTDESGAYRLGLDSRTQYKLTTTYQGLRHTVWPVFVLDNETGIYDINLTRAPKTMLTGTYAGWEPESKRPDSITIEATPVGGGTPITVTMGPDYNYTLEVEPLTYYGLYGRYRGSNGSYYKATFAYNGTGIVFQGFMLRPNETALVNVLTYEDNVSLEKP